MTTSQLETQRQSLSRLQKSQKELDNKIRKSKDLERFFKDLKSDVDREQEVINDLTQNQISPPMTQLGPVHCEYRSPK